MKRYGWEIFFGVSMLVLSFVFYFVHYVVFKDSHHIFIFLIGDIAFVFFEVLLVSMIIHQLLSMRERRARLEKLNMVIGTFFSRVGTKLLAYISDYDPNLEMIRKKLIITNDWSDQDFSRVSKGLKNQKYGVDIQNVKLEEFRTFLVGEIDFLLRLMESPTLLEHEAFTELLMAVFHLSDEFAAREDMSNLPATDSAHIAGDIKRVYVLLVREWLQYMKHLKDNYPYLFSLAVRTNPFDQSASVIVM
ncbi:MAG: hypothetical protein SVY10_08955 [Thermodesulfobacteriota bacterium]|nr:hypothetical protein [Thermodesulfobacteriota bacterium]